MHAWEAIQNSLNYIEDHLTENIKVESLANAAALSPFYFQRLFRRLVKKPVKKHMALRRKNTVPILSYSIILSSPICF